MGWLAGTLQVLGGLAVVVGLFLALDPGAALAVCGGLAVACGTVLEVARHPRVVARPLSAHERTVHSLADRAAHASER